MKGLVAQSVTDPTVLTTAMARELVSALIFVSAMTDGWEETAVSHLVLISSSALVVSAYVFEVPCDIFFIDFQVMVSVSGLTCVNVMSFGKENLVTHHSVLQEKMILQSAVGMVIVLDLGYVSVMEIITAMHVNIGVSTPQPS